MEETIVRSSYSPALVEHVIETTRNVVVERAFREQVGGSLLGILILNASSLRWNSYLLRWTWEAPGSRDSMSSCNVWAHE